MNSKTFRIITTLFAIIMAVFLIASMLLPETSIVQTVMGYTGVILFAGYYTVLLAKILTH